MLLTQSSLASWNAAHLAAETDRTTRVKVFTMSGVQIGKAGIGESDERLTFPRRYLVREALAGTSWIRFATEEEMMSDKTWWRYSECQPATLVHGFGDNEGKVMVAAAEHPMGLYGCLMQAFEQTVYVVSFDSPNLCNSGNELGMRVAPPIPEQVE